MSETHIEQAQQQADLQKRLWAIANDLRGNMDASEYRNYMLGLIFYRFLSGRVEDYVNKQLANDEITFAQAYADKEIGPELTDDVTQTLGFFIQPDYLYSSLVNDIESGKFDIEKLQMAVNEVENSTIGRES
ncbi:type I restriction-modification system subunit M N-terminal domain-containing protein, partial [Lactobacillus acetotolerans]|uniref:type I restriction-modification system subunit M N-terminal domain-containing protein n=1 Tax=Lactobacillus acetotolerans TaxID=1600 RepID=UPI002FDA3A0F